MAEQGREPTYPPIPRVPAHVCPHCRYHLTGLTTRRCPECGKLFTQREALAAGRGEKPAQEKARRQVPGGQAIVLWLCVLVTALSLYVPTWAGWHSEDISAMDRLRFEVFFLVVASMIWWYWAYVRMNLTVTGVMIGIAVIAMVIGGTCLSCG